MKYKHIFWDWNGTLLDDAHAAHAAVNAMLTKRGLPNITFEQYREYIDVPIIRFYEKVMDMSEESMEDMSVEFNSLCAENLSEHPVFDHVHDLLRELSEQGIKHYIFSSSQNKFIEPHLEKSGLSKYFTDVLGANDCYVGSKAERTKAYLELHCILPSESLFVGDMVHDSDVATAVGADCVLVSAGHQCENTLAFSGRKIISSLAEFSALINRL